MLLKLVFFFWGGGGRTWIRASDFMGSSLLTVVSMGVTDFCVCV